jgi:hypothetical protein
MQRPRIAAKVQRPVVRVRLILGEMANQRRFAGSLTADDQKDLILADLPNRIRG